MVLLLWLVTEFAAATVLVLHSILLCAADVNRL